MKIYKNNKRRNIVFFVVAAAILLYIFIPQLYFSNYSSSARDIPEPGDYAIYVSNNNLTYFSKEELEKAKDSYEEYGELDHLKRCTYATASISSDTMPKGEREELKIKPSGWDQEKYEGIIEDDFLYNRCHLIAYCLTAENNNPNNLVTGTHYMNENMNYYEVLVAKYLDNNPNNHVLYRASPIFEGNDLVCRGILLEAKSIEDDEIEFCVFVNNIQPGIEIDYSDGSSCIDYDYQK